MRHGQVERAVVALSHIRRAGMTRGPPESQFLICNVMCMYISGDIGARISDSVFSSFCFLFLFFVFLFVSGFPAARDYHLPLHLCWLVGWLVGWLEERRGDLERAKDPWGEWWNWAKSDLTAACRYDDRFCRSW